MPKLRILLDECVDRRLADHIKDHSVSTTPEMGWGGLSNGELLTLAQAHFDIFLTTDRNLQHQQNLSKFDVAVIVLHAPSNRLDDLLPLIPALYSSLPNVRPGTCGVIVR